MLRPFALIPICGLMLAACDAPTGTGNTFSATGGGTRTATPEVEEACASAARIESGVEEVAILNSEFSEANSVVTILAGGTRWRCLSSNDGLVAEIGPIA